MSIPANQETWSVRDLQNRSRRADLASLSITSQRSGDAANDPITEAIKTVRNQVAEEHPEWVAQLKSYHPQIVRAAQEKLESQSLTLEEKALALKTLDENLFGFGPLDGFMTDNSITEIIVDSPTEVDIERGGQLYRVATTWRSDADLLEYIKQLIRNTGRPLDRSHPIVDCEVQGARINATMAPVSKHPTLNIRKSVAQTHKYTAEELIAAGTIDVTGLHLLLALIRASITTLICGKTGTGKTTTARTLIEQGALEETRWIMMEDVRETEAQVLRFLSLQTVESHEYAISADDLFNATKRKRPDRIAIGEVRSGAQASPFIMTLMAGHDGALSTMHAGTPYDAIDNFVFFLKQAGMAVQEDFLEKLLHRSLPIMVFIHRTRKGLRRIVRIVEVRPLGDPENPSGFRDLYRYHRETKQWQWEHPISEELAERMLLEEVAVPVFGDTVPPERLKDLDLPEALME